MRYAGRLAKIEQALTLGRENPQVIALRRGEDPEEALRRVERDPDRLLTVFVRKHFPWKTGGGSIRGKGSDLVLTRENPKTEIPETEASVDDQIKQVLSELEGRGVPREDIPDLLSSPLRADDLLKLFPLRR